MIRVLNNIFVKYLFYYYSCLSEIYQVQMYLWMRFNVANKSCCMSIYAEYIIIIINIDNNLCVREVNNIGNGKSRLLFILNSKCGYYFYIVYPRQI